VSWIVSDRVKETTTTTGTGDLTLAGAVAQFQAFSAVCADLDQVPYAIVGQTGTEWEVGIGTWHAGNTLTRTRVLASSNAGALVVLSAGTKDVFLDWPATHGREHPFNAIQATDQYLPPDTSVYVADNYEVAAGKELEIAWGATFEVG
jgi:hypothetical protein